MIDKSKQGVNNECTERVYKTTRDGCVNTQL